MTSPLIRYLQDNHGGYIVSLRNQKSPLSYLDIAKAIIDQDKTLKNKTSKLLRKQIREAYLNVCQAGVDITENTSESKTNEGPGYSENVVETDAFKKYCKAEGIDINRVKSCKYVNHLGQQKFNIVMDFDDKNEKTYFDHRDDIIADMDAHSPLYEKFKRIKKRNDGRLLVIGLADLHLNQLSSYTETHEKYYTKLAVDKAVEGVLSLLEESKGYDITHVLFPLGGDVLNVDTPKNTTTSGTHQDTDMMWYDAFVTARKMFVAMIDATLARGYKVVIKHIVANHDYMSGFMLTDTIKSWFRNTDIDFDVDMHHRKYYRFGLNMIAITHGDSAKKDKLALLASNEFKYWSDTKFRYIYTQHIHHKTVAVDEIGVAIQSLRTPTVASGWASRNGYQHSQSSIAGFVHDQNHGQIAELNHNF